MKNPKFDSIGNKMWYNEQGQYHRTDGPAIEWTSGTKCWYQMGLRHRTDGPAIEWPDGEKGWYIQGQPLTEEDHRLLSFACYNTV